MFVGPIVGEVTETTARVVVQPLLSGMVTVVLTPEGGGPATRGSAVATDDAPVVSILLVGLTAETTYALTVEVDGAVVAGRKGKVRTRGAADDELKVAAVSCNFTVRKDDTNRWHDLLHARVLTGDVSAVLHIGDQVYGDVAFGQSMQDVKDQGRTAAVVQAITARFRRLYQYTWNYEPTREVLANTSNLMIWDDHEIRNGWGSHEEDRDPTSNEYFVGDIARKVFQEYQRGLWAPPDATVAHEGHAHAYGTTGVVFLDQRGARSFAYDASRPYLGRAQMAWFDQTLASPAFAKVTALLVVTSVPLLYVGERAADLGGLVASDLRDQWSYASHCTEQFELITRLRRWKEEDRHRTVAVVGGDVHVGGRTVLEEKVPDSELWRPILTQFITSPITNSPLHALAFWGVKTLLLGGDHEITPSLRYRHESLTRRRNYALISLYGTPGEQAHIVGSLAEDPQD